MAVKAKNKSTKETPLMKQYYSIKGKYPDALLLFRVGDFYETFGEDAVKASKVLGIVLTKRKNGAAAFVDLAGFPHHSLDTYLPKLVRAGYRVAICDQLEDPKLAKKIVKRGVTELVTPGVTLNENVLDNKSNNFLGSVHFGKSAIGVSFLDVSTGEFITSEGNKEYVQKLIQGFSPSEILYQRQHEERFNDAFGNNLQTFQLDEWVFQDDFAKEKLLDQFKTLSLKGFGIEGLDNAIIASGAILEYLSNTHHPNLNHITGISRIQKDEYVWLDQFTIRNLELIHSNNPDGVSLLQIMDHTSSPMGARLLRRWMLFPLKCVEKIEERLEVVSSLIEKEHEIADLALNLKQVGDLERIISRVAVKKINPRELLHLKKSLEIVKPIQDFCDSTGSKILKAISKKLDSNPELTKIISETLHDEAPALLSKGMVIKEGANPELDELRSIAFSGKDHLIQLQQKESEATGIPSLKIGYNNVFGYYLEVRNTHKDKVPEEWIRKQTLTQAERYITPELKEYEQKILGAEEKISALESKIYAQLLEGIQSFIPSVQHTASTLAQIDCLLSFAKLAIRNAYTRPHLNSGYGLNIIDGRHPVIEQNLPLGEKYVSNDTYLDNDSQQILVITGPNMSGKSALLRQAALIVLMAQMGSYVPAKSAELGLIDRIFTRVGASDNISSGESTFMVEMNETASILNNLSDRSLILLDEIGRGTSTYDGISIAWAITEFIHESESKAKTLFATHYHELNDMAEQFKRIKNFNVSVKEVDKKIIFLRKLKPGGSAHSFGIEVAKMAGIPHSIVNRAKVILKHLEKAHRQEGRAHNIEDDIQLSFIKLDDPALESIRDELINIDINTLTPVEALLKLNEIKKLVGG